MKIMRDAPDFVYASCGLSRVRARAPGAALGPMPRVEMAPAPGDVE
jgi:hypothetical protein